METIVNKNKAIKKIAKKYNITVDAKKWNYNKSVVKINFDNLLLLENKTDFINNECRKSIDKNTIEYYSICENQFTEHNNINVYFNEIGKLILNDIFEILFKDMEYLKIWEGGFLEHRPFQYIDVELYNFQ